MPRRWLLVAGLVASSVVYAQDKKPDVPRITALAPFDVLPGKETTLRIRGVKLSNATEVRFAGGLKAEIKEKKTAEVPNGLDAKDVGDTQLEVKLTVPADLPVGPLALTVVTPEGITAPRELRVLDAAKCVDEREPNGGLREAQPIELGRTLRGTLNGDKDVDVFQFTGKSGQRIAAEVFAARGASLLDSTVTLMDARGGCPGICRRQRHARLPAQPSPPGRRPVFPHRAGRPRPRWTVAQLRTHRKGGAMNFVRAFLLFPIAGTAFADAATRELLPRRGAGL